MGIPVHIANGKTTDIVLRVLNNDIIGTRFPAKKGTSNFKKYMAHAYEEPKGIIMINAGARAMLLSDKAKSLLPVGMLQVAGKFKKGDIIRIVDEKTRNSVRMARYGHEKQRKSWNEKSEPIIHYDHYIYINCTNRGNNKNFKKLIVRSRVVRIPEDNQPILLGG